MDATTHRDLPGFREDYARAFRLQQEPRDLAFLNYPITLCGTPSRNMCLRDVAALSYADNGFICGGTPGLGDALNAAWLLSPEWCLESGGRINRYLIRRRRGRVFREVCRGLSTAEVVSTVADFVDMQFVDADSGEGNGEKPSLPRAAMPAHYVHFFAYYYHAAEDWVLSCPLPRLFQYVHKIRSELDPKYKNRQLTDRVEHRYLAEFNRLTKQESTE